MHCDICTTFCKYNHVTVPEGNTIIIHYEYVIGVGEILSNDPIRLFFDAVYIIIIGAISWPRLCTALTSQFVSVGNRMCLLAHFNSPL